jgi:hypothetical protein
VEELLFSVLNVHNVGDVRQIEVDTAETLVPGPSRLDDKNPTAKIKSINRQVVTKFRQK